MSYEWGLCDVTMNMEQPVVGVFNWVIRGIILHLNAQNLNDSEIYWKIVKTYGENAG